MLLNCCVEVDAEVEDECQKKFDAWAEQERCGSRAILLLASKIC